MLDRAVTVTHRQGVTAVRSEPVWAERVQRLAAGDDREAVDYRLRWAAWIYGGVMGGTHSEEVLLVDGSLSYRLERVSKEALPGRSAERRRFMVVSGYRVA